MKNEENKMDSHDQPVSKRMLWTGILIVVGIAVLLVGIHFLKKYKIDLERAKRDAEIGEGLHILAGAARLSPTEQIINVPGDARPYATATIYAKLSGYLKEINVDKGDKVKAGDTIAVIESPETTMDYEGALADAKNKQTIAKRMKTLQARKLISDQEAEQAFSDADVAQARVESLKALKGYETVLAPFAGKITARYADPGALVQNAASSQTSALPLVLLSQTDRLRIYVYLDQKSAAFVQNGDLAEITLTERPEVKVSAPITRISGELDVRTRTMLVEIDVDNASEVIVPNSFVQVQIKLKKTALVEIPMEALVSRDDKSFVAIIEKDDTIKFREVRIGDNDGIHCQIIGGLAVGEPVALNVGNNVIDGQHVKVIRDK